MNGKILLILQLDIDVGLRARWSETVRVQRPALVFRVNGGALIMELESWECELQQWLGCGNEEDLPILTQPLSVISRLDTLRSLMRLEWRMSQLPQDDSERSVLLFIPIYRFSLFTRLPVNDS